MLAPTDKLTSVDEVRELSRRARKDLRLSQEELARAIGVSRNWVADFERGKTDPGFETMLKALYVLGLELRWNSLPRLVVDGATTGGTSLPNEDAWGTCGSMAWVIDGAPMPGQGDETRAYVQRLSTALESLAAEGGPLSRTVAQSIEMARDLWARPHPSATLAIISVAETVTEWLVLGDASVVFRVGRVTTRVCDDRLDRVAVAERRARREGRRAGVSSSRLQTLHENLYKAESAQRNRAGGFWVASDSPEAAFQALTGTSATDQPIALCTDGVSSLVGSPGHWPDLDAAYMDWTRRGPSAVITNLSTDAGKDRSISDDATLVVVQL